MNIQQQTTPEVSNTETVMADNEELDTPPPQDISNLFAAEDLSSCSSSYSVKYKREWIKAKVIRSYILSSGKCPDACSKSLSIALNHKQIASIMAVTSAIFQNKKTNTITRHEQKKKNIPCNISRKNENKQKTYFFVISNIVAIVSSPSKKSDQNEVHAIKDLLQYSMSRAYLILKKVFYKMWTFDCSSPQYKGEMVYQTMHCPKKKFARH